ncbi:MAG: DNA recombination protein RecN [gamma proteobacterium symbiont of Ctena orbiculata]|uniref:LapA family protein n=1 Tax=Candidatus Thiodiazotropha sp. CDECU1 TaxID=3065865 RepID=UPI000D583976|nr:LapA family protein [Candidatus Thiodiazotropha sp. CDECU1]PVV05878.1 MAG: DNA recombination protein RecN [gamma proteobacterium symbiont of Ctena orbiculata]PVV21442.1 MAG: DNA recombination protein RecN [gamma proteobacterium symbiont of Ctena orbiculata]
MRFIKLFIVILIMLLGAVFTVLNADPVEVNYYFGRREIPLSLILTIALGFGVVLGVLAGMGKVLGLKREIHKLKRRSQLVSEEVNNLRALPLKEQ